MPYLDPRDRRAWEMYVALVAAQYTHQDFNLSEYKTFASLFNVVSEAYLLADAFEQGRRHQNAPPEDDAELEKRISRFTRNVGELQDPLRDALPEQEPEQERRANQGRKAKSLEESVTKQKGRHTRIGLSKDRET